jgi:hypothetical protein
MHALGSDSIKTLSVHEEVLGDDSRSGIASSADADEVKNELSATQNPPNSRRFSSLVSLLS